MGLTSLKSTVRQEPCEAVSEPAVGSRSFGAPTWLAEAVALAWHSPRGVLPPPYQLRRLSLRARAPEQHSGDDTERGSAHEGKGHRTGTGTGGV